MTISISWAPTRTATSVSAILLSVVVAPSGKPTTVHTFTGEPANSAATSGTQYGFTHTLANLYLRGSWQIFTTSAWGASGLRRVWSMRLAMAESIFVSRSLAEIRSAPMATISLVLTAQVC